MEQEIIEINGSNLTYEKIEKISLHEVKVKISECSLKRLEDAWKLVKKLENGDKSIYGLNTGVGWNKDIEVDKDFCEKYNRNLIKSHMIGINPECCVAEIRTILLLRLNGFLCGHTGISPEAAKYYELFLNRGIHPVIKKRASVSMGDIGTLSAIGLVLIGEGEVFYKNKRLMANEVFEIEGIEPFKLGAKEGLSIVSSNAQSSAFAAIALINLEHFLDIYHTVFCLSLEGVNGVVDPLDETVNNVRKHKGQIEVSKICRENLEGSYLFDSCKYRALQDPLSFRSNCAITGAVVDAVNYLKEQLYLEINTPDDNPCILPEENRCVGSSNFVPLSWVLGMEMVAIALNHLSKMMCNRMLCFSDPSFTNLSRFLSPDENKTIGFGTIQKTFASLDSENRLHANPTSLDFMSLAGQIENHSTNATIGADKITKIVDNLYYMLGMELMHAAQAVDLRENYKLGKKTSTLYKDYREVVDFLHKDRNLSIDIENSYEFLKNYEMLN